jgi:hypothetical protein
MISITTGSVRTSSAVTLPREELVRTESKSGSDEVKKYIFDLIASHDYNEQSSKANCGHGGDGIFGRCGTFFCFPVHFSPSLYGAKEPNSNWNYG